MTTGASDSQTQSASTKGDCKWGGFFGVVEQDDFEKYVEQNINEIKSQMAIGQGGHLDVISGFLGCSQTLTIGPVMQKNMSHFVDFRSQDALQFIEKLHAVVAEEPSLSRTCPSAAVARN